VHPDLSKLLLTYIDGIPKIIAQSLLPVKCMFNPLIYNLIYRNGNTTQGYTKEELVKFLRAIINYISKLELISKTEWSDYSLLSADCVYTKKQFALKQRTVTKLLSDSNAIVDIGGNDGSMLDKVSCNTIVVDIDPVSANNAFNSKYVKNVIVSDICNPSPSIGWKNQERDNLIIRLPIATYMLLAIIHHLVLRFNITIPMTLKLLVSKADYLIIEWIQPDDPNIVKYLSHKHSHHKYTEDYFLSTFTKYYKIISTYKITKHRKLYYMKRKNMIPKTEDEIKESLFEELERFNSKKYGMRKVKVTPSFPMEK